VNQPCPLPDLYRMFTLVRRDGGSIVNCRYVVGALPDHWRLPDVALSIEEVKTVGFHHRLPLATSDGETLNSSVGDHALRNLRT